jgi:hypothetical protein
MRNRLLALARSIRLRALSEIRGKVLAAVAELNAVGMLQEPVMCALWIVALPCCMAVLEIQELVNLIGQPGKLCHLA